MTKIARNKTEVAAPRTPTYRPPPAEAAAIRKGEAEIARGEAVTLNELLHAPENRRPKMTR